MADTVTETKGAPERGSPKTRIGIVTSNKMQKTVVVMVQRRAAHGQYGKIQTRKEKYKAHAEDHDYPKKPSINVGDKVLIAETRPMSKDKRWRVAKVLELVYDVLIVIPLMIERWVIGMRAGSTGDTRNTEDKELSKLRRAA